MCLAMVEHWLVVLEDSGANENSLLQYSIPIKINDLAVVLPWPEGFSPSMANRDEVARRCAKIDYEIKGSSYHP